MQQPDLMWCQLKNWGHLLTAIAANLYYRFPAKKMLVVGVTGTDGKTTTCHLIEAILHQAGKKTAVISTLSVPGLHTTTPDPWSLQQRLRLLADRGREYAVLEASSHGLAQNRLWGIDFEVGVVTNITHDHLDYHGSYERYLEAKAKLIKRAKTAILNKDDISYKKLKTCLPAGRAQNSKFKTYGLQNSVDFNPRKFPFKTKLPGMYNQYNCLAAIAACSVLGIEPEKIRAGIEGFEGVEGRMEEIKEGQDFKVYVDFASTPNSLKNVLVHLRKETKNDLWVVFGAAGLRDRQKRPLMGEIACQLADKVVLTTEDPRTEKAEEIIEQIAAGCRDKEKIFRVLDRREAIKLAIDRAEEDDVIVICGKGHEKSMCFGKTEIPWSDQEETRKALRNRLKKYKSSKV